MKSTIRKDFYLKDGVYVFGFVEYPDYCGIPEIGYVSNGHYNSAELEYKGHLIPEPYIADTMWDRYEEDCEELGVEPSEKDFDGRYMKENADVVYELIEMIIHSKKKAV
jgi:hypothetical protein